MNVFLSNVATRTDGNSRDLNFTISCVRHQNQRKFRVTSIGLRIISDVGRIKMRILHAFKQFLEIVDGFLGVLGVECEINGLHTMKSSSKFFGIPIHDSTIYIKCQYPSLPFKDSSLSIHSCTGIILYLSLLSLITTSLIPALIIRRLHIEQLQEF